MKLVHYYIMFAFSLLSVAVVPLFLPYGGITADSISYFQLADTLEHPKWSLFPLLYPALIRFFNLFFKDYFWASHVLNVLLFASVGLFSILKRFYVKETLVLLTCKIFLFCYFNIISEALFLTLFYFLCYYLIRFFRSEISDWHFYVPAGILMVLMFATRYSGLYILVGFGLFYLGYYWKHRAEFLFFRHDFFKFLLTSSVGVLAYMLFNRVLFGDFMGEVYRHDPYLKGIGEDFFRNILGLINSFNPILGLKLQGSSLLVYGVEAVLLMINVVFIVVFVKQWRGYFQSVKALTYFHYLMIISGSCFAGLVFVTVFFQGVEELNMRMLAEASFCFIFSIILISFEVEKYERYIFGLACVSLLFNTFYNLKEPSDFLGRKAFIEKTLNETVGKKYYFIDTDASPELKVYRIPLVNKEVNYMHQNQQAFHIDGNIIMMTNPAIQWILKDTVVDKSTVIYSSQIPKMGDR